MENLRESFSYSKLSTFESCPFKYKLIYKENNYINTNSIATTFGTLIHYIEEQIGISIKNGLKIDYSMLNSLISNGNDEVKGIEEIKKLYKSDFYTLDKSNLSYNDKIEIYRLKSIYRLEKYMQDNSDYIILGLEVPFEFDYLDYKFKGFIDRLLYDKSTNTYIVQDIKTYSKIVDNKTLNNPLQFVVYSLALMSKYGEDISIKCQYDLPLLDTIQTCNMNIEKGIIKLSKLFNKIKVSEFKPNPTPLCHWCPFCRTFENQPEEAKNKCFYYSLWTREHKTFQVENKWQGVEVHKKLLENINN